MSGAPPRHPCGGNAGDAALDRETVVFEQSGEIFRCLEFLIGKLAETENGVIDHLRELAAPTRRCLLANMLPSQCQQRRLLLAWSFLTSYPSDREMPKLAVLS